MTYDLGMGDRAADRGRTDAGTYDLVDHRRSGHAQFGEDGILAKIFEDAPPRHRWCVEIGAWDGVHLSNTASLLEQGWSGVLVEADRGRYAELQRNWAHRPDVATVHRRVGVDSDGLDAVLAITATPTDLDLLSIDVDGDDHHIWEALRSYEPRVVVIEANFSFPFNVEFVQKRGSRPGIGSSALSLNYLANSKGYQLVCYNVVNCIFARPDVAAALRLRHRSFEYLFHVGLEQHLSVAMAWSGRLFVFGDDVYARRRNPLARMWNAWVRREGALRRRADRFNIVRGAALRKLFEE